MPLICLFYGIAIYMYYDDHNPPHFHAKYNEYEVIIAIQNLSIIAGEIPPRALGLIIEWAKLNQKELLKDWQLVKKLQKPNKIAPLK
ncbi:MAG: DUF4160 domain-containing protein [Candidatus Caenarcaniphilales bacterium]|nr:DUF4160 domain-containing protein [Candidatus Caenarcaniphilales bacterium]